MDILIDSRFAAGALLGVMFRVGTPMTRHALHEIFSKMFLSCYKNNTAKLEETFNAALRLLFMSYGITHEGDGDTQIIKLSHSHWKSG